MLKVRAPALPADEVLRRVARGDRPFLLDATSDGDGLGRYSFAGCDPDDGLVWRTGDAGDPLALLEDAQRRWTTGPVDDDWPIAIGYLSYDLAAAALARAHGRRIAFRDDLGLPGVDFARYRAIWRLDHRSGEAQVLAHDAAAAEHLLGRLARSPVPLHPVRASPLGPTWSRQEYSGKVTRILEHLRAGDCYQVNLAQRLACAIEPAAAEALYLRLRAVAPAPLGAFLRTDAVTLLSNSPELLLRVRTERVDGRYVVTAESRPIKGTRPRGADPDEDARLAAALAASEKDGAEHLMIVDLVRNDLGRVAEAGSVRAAGPRALGLATVHHLVSTVSARVARGGTADLLAALLPGGSITGAPKLRVVEIIAALEAQARGVYCGAVGWLGAGRAMHLMLPIRTGMIVGRELIVPVGGGVVLDSTPDGEWDETLVKARAFVRALDQGSAAHT